MTTRNDEHLETAAGPSRRAVLGGGALGVALAGALPREVYAAAGKPLRVGLVGCGNRGRGAVQNAMTASPDVRLVAIADAFADKLEKTKKIFADPALAPKTDLPAERCFSGLDAYKKLVALDLDYVILASPPGFRPAHVEAAVAAGRNVFAEKPVAVDGPGIRQCLAAHDEASRKKLAIVCGTQRRHDAAYLESMKRIAGGAIGEIVAARCAWNQGTFWVNKRQPGWTDAEWQIRNWPYFVWLSGDQIVEQNIHNIDVINWAMGAHPVAAIGVGGRQQRVEPDCGHVFDHMAIDFEYGSGAHMTSMCRQQGNCANDVGEYLVGTKGRAEFRNNGKSFALITKGKTWQPSAKDRDPYVQEHADLIAMLRAGKPSSDLRSMAESTLTAIMGRMAAYTGQRVTWEQALHSKESTFPADLKLGPLPVAKVAVPGVTPFI